MRVKLADFGAAMWSGGVPNLVCSIPNFYAPEVTYNYATHKFEPESSLSVDALGIDMHNDSKLGYYCSTLLGLHKHTMCNEAAIGTFAKLPEIIHN